MINVRELHPDDDLEPVLKLCRDFFSEYAGHHRDFFDTENLSDVDISGRFMKSLESDDSATLIALADGAVVGYASVAIRNQAPFYRVKKVGSISALMVAAEYRRRGVATLLMKEAREYFRRHGIKYYTFYTAVANEAAVRLYEKLRMEPLHMSFLGET